MGVQTNIKYNQLSNTETSFVSNLWFDIVKTAIKVYKAETGNTSL